MKDVAKLFVKKLLLEKNINYVELATKMIAKGYKETPDTIRTKINRGSYSFAFLLEICDTLNLEIRIEDKEL